MMRYLNEAVRAAMTGVLCTIGIIATGRMFWAGTVHPSRVKYPAPPLVPSFVAWLTVAAALFIGSSILWLK